MAEQGFDLMEIVSTAATLPGVKIDRSDFLRKEFGAPKYGTQLAQILREGPLAAGVSAEDVEKHANGVISYETTKTTAISAAAGIPGGLAMLGTIPADLAQFYGHVLRVIQKLMYLYGWDDIENMDEETKNVLIIFIGAMSGVQAAEATIGKLCNSAAVKVSKTLAAKALTKTTYYPIVKSVCKQIGVKMTKDVFAKSVSKAIPVIGAVASGGLTAATFLPMSKKLLKLMKNNA